MSRVLHMIRRRAFTLVELLVVIGIISVLIAFLMPALGRAREQANGVVCLSNLRQCGLSMIMYANDHKNAVMPLYVWDYGTTPVGIGTGQWTALGTMWDLGYLKSKYITRCPSDKVVTSGAIHGAYSFGPYNPSNALNEDGKAGYAYNYFAFGQYYITVDPSLVSGRGALGVLFKGVRRQDVKHPEETYWMGDNSDVAGIGGALLYFDNPNLVRRHGMGLNMLWADGHATWLTGLSAYQHGYYFHTLTPSTNWWDDIN